MKKASPAPDLYKTKQHFEILDGLRGVAALAVVIFHFMEWIFPDFSKNFIAHGFLAVDFFFCLSGFVVGYAYDNRVESMGLWEFFKIRLIRLHPLVFLGAVLGLLALLLDSFALPHNYGGGKLLLLFLASAFLIPWPSMEDRAFNIFGLNAPSWSLFWEYVANIFYALILIRMGRRALIGLTILSAALLVYVSYSAGNLLGGWNGDTFWHGGARIAYSFSAGLLIYRSNWIIKNNTGFPSLALILSFAFLMPWTAWNWLTEVLVVLLFFPLIVALGAGSILENSWKSICRFSGNISYPLYMTHYAVMWIFGNWYTTQNPAPAELYTAVFGGIALLVVFAYLAMRFYDLPVRRYLNKVWRTGPKSPG